MPSGVGVQVPPSALHPSRPEQVNNSRCDRAQRLSAVGDPVLRIGGQLGRRQVALLLLGHEQHVVPEAAAAAQLPDDTSAHDTRGEGLRTAGVAQRHCAPELAPASRVGYVGQLVEQELIVPLVAPRQARPARREDPGHLVERIDAQTAVVGQRRQPGRLHPRSRLHQGVALERRLVLDRLVVRRDVVEAEDLEAG